MFDQLGTPSYMAPELWSVHGPLEYDSSVDVWAVGVVTFLLLSGRRPWDHPDREEKRRMIRHDKLRFPSPAWDKISQDAKYAHRRLCLPGTVQATRLWPPSTELVCLAPALLTWSPRSFRPRAPFGSKGLL